MLKSKWICLLAFLQLTILCAHAKTFSATTYSISNLEQFNQALNQAQDADILKLSEGVYSGNFIIKKSLTIDCEPNVNFDGAGKNSTFRAQAKNIKIKGCNIQNWGHNLTNMDAAIFVEKSASNITITHNYLKGDGFGIWLDASPSPTVSHNRIQGNSRIRSQDRGNGVHLFNVTGADIAFNEILQTRDGIYIDTSNGNKLRNNKIHDLRYGIHYMFSFHNLIEKNQTSHTRTGYALMQSKYLTVIDNSSDQDQNYGILMNYITRSTIKGNKITGVHQMIGPGGFQVVKGAEGKALFIYNSLYNDISHNRIQQSELGIHITAGSEDNNFYNNDFIANRQQVKYVANRSQEWSKDGHGNYWSDYLGWDRDANGIGDTSHEPNDGIDKLLWKYPAAKVLMNSPAIEMLRWVQKTFPVLNAKGVKDSFPLMKPGYLNPETFHQPLSNNSEVTLSRSSIHVSR